MLRYKGSKKMIADHLSPLFPPHTRWIEPFFGAGGMFFQKRKAQYNFLNDLNDDIYSLWKVLQTQALKLQTELTKIPQHQSIFNEFKAAKPTDPFQKALRFVYLSALSYLGGRTTMCTKITFNIYKLALENIPIYSQLLQNCKLFSCDFRAFLKNISFRCDNERLSSFIYCDPPYVNTGGYDFKWKEQDLIDLIEILKDMGVKFAISEFDTPLNQTLADRYKLNYYQVVGRQNLKKRRVEILMTNYDAQNKLF